MSNHKEHSGFWTAIAKDGKSVDGLAHLWCALVKKPIRPHLACRSKLDGGVWVDLVWRADLPLCRLCLNVYRHYHKTNTAYDSYDPPIARFVGEERRAYKERLRLKFLNVQPRTQKAGKGETQ